jgi:hypothetical protein
MPSAPDNDVGEPPTLHRPPLYAHLITASIGKDDVLHPVPVSPIVAPRGVISHARPVSALAWSQRDICPPPDSKPLQASVPCVTSQHRPRKCGARSN